MSVLSHADHYNRVETFGVNYFEYAIVKIKSLWVVASIALVRAFDLLDVYIMLFIGTLVNRIVAEIVLPQSPSILNGGGPHWRIQLLANE